jgi:hypothetical protein
MDSTEYLGGGVVSDHFDTDDPRTDLTDLYAFPAAVPGRTVLVLDFNPEPADQDVPFDTAASYELKIDTDGDAEADVAFGVLFSSASGAATATVYRSTGSLARESGPVGAVVIDGAPVSLDGGIHVTEANGYRFFAGVRSDPHFKDVKGFQNKFQFTGEDPVALRDVIGIVLELPNDALAPSPPVRVWARTTKLGAGTATIIDQAGLPGTNNTWNVEDADNAAFSVTPPSEQAAAFRPLRWGSLLMPRNRGNSRRFGGQPNSAAQSRQVGNAVIPSVWLDRHTATPHLRHVSLKLGTCGIGRSATPITTSRSVIASASLCCLSVSAALLPRWEPSGRLSSVEWPLCLPQAHQPSMPA